MNEEDQEYDYRETVKEWEIVLKDQRAEIDRLKPLLTRAANALECFVDYPIKFVQELRDAANGKGQAESD